MVMNLREEKKNLVMAGVFFLAVFFYTVHLMNQENAFSFLYDEFGKAISYTIYLALFYPLRLSARKWDLFAPNVRSWIVMVIALFGFSLLYISIGLFESYNRLVLWILLSLVSSFLLDTLFAESIEEDIKQFLEEV